MRYFVYILLSLKDKKHYIGSSSDVLKRLEYHNAGRQRSTKHRIPFILIYSEEFDSKTDALKRERYLKSLKGGVALKKIIGE